MHPPGDAVRRFLQINVVLGPPQPIRLGVMRRFPALILWLLALVVGGGSLLLFGWFLVIGPVQEATPGRGQVAALLWDAGLSLLFFAQHSGMVRKSFRGWLERRVDRAFHAAIYAVASGVVLAAVVLLWEPTRVVVWSADDLMWFFLRGITVLTAVGFAWAVLELDEFDTFGVGALRNRLRRDESKAPRLALHGPYRWVRHPLYLGTILLIWTVPHVTTDRLLFNLLWTAWVVLAARWEERDLAETFGGAYRHYQAAVPMLFPVRGPMDAATLQWLERERGRGKSEE